MLKPLEPILVIDLFPDLLAELLELLSSLSTEHWESATVCRGWSVKDIASHLLAGDVGILSRKRDKYLGPGAGIETWEDLVQLINTLNDTWVKAMRRISGQLLGDLLRTTGAQVCEYFKSLDPFELGGPVDWVSPDPAPVWLDLAREYTERWHHQQQIREAVGAPSLKQPKYLAPVLDTFVRGLPRAFSGVAAPEGSSVTLTVTGESGATWSVVSEKATWRLYLEAGQAPGSPEPTAAVTMPEDLAWRLFTKGVSREGAERRSEFKGDLDLASKVLDVVSIIG